MGNIQGQFDVGSFYNITAAAPLDVRTLVKTELDLIAEDSWNKKTHPPYKGMMVTVQETGNVYILIDVDNVHSIDGWKKVGSDLDSFPFGKGDTDNSAVLKGGDNQTTSANEVALGKYNNSNSSTYFSVGIGTSNTDRKNAHEIMQDGKHYVYGVGGYDGTNPSESSDLASFINNNSSKLPVVNSNEELGALDVPLGTIAGVVHEGYEVIEGFGKHKNDVDKPMIKEINIIGDIPILDKGELALYFTNNTKLQYLYAGGPTILQYQNLINGFSYYIYASYSGFDEDALYALNSLLNKQEHRLDYIEDSDTILSTLDSFLQGVFVIPSEVDTYIKTEKGLDLPTPIYRKFSDFGDQPELINKEERIIKNFDIIGEVIQSGNVWFETIGGTSITINGRESIGWSIAYNDSEYVPLDDIELQKFKDLVNSTTVYYMRKVGASGFTSGMDNMFSADFPPIYKPVELTTWSKAYTQQDALTDSEIDAILNEVFNDSYYYYGDDGIGAFDLDEGQVVEEVEQTNIE